jgi:SAM-dependent methyltransferase
MEAPTQNREAALSPVIAGAGEIMICPVCGGGLDLTRERISCLSCGHEFPSEEGIPQLFWRNEWPAGKPDVTETIKAFYEEVPFPNYDEVDSASTLREKATKGVFARLLDEQIPFGAKILEAGCGTGQLSNFLGSTWGRTVFAGDACMNSLKLADRFRRENQIKGVAFFQMNLFRPPFKPETFDFVISNGVLHHTSDPRLGFQTIAKLVKPGGVVMIGLYNKYARLVTDFIRMALSATGDRVRFLDPRLRDKSINEVRKHTWFMDRFKNPHESKHSIAEVQGWFEDAGFEFLNSIPKASGEKFAADEKLFEPHPKGTKSDQFFVQMGELMSGGRDGGLFVMIGRRVK